MPAAAFGSVTTVGSVLMVEVMIGIDPHKGSHTAVVIGVGEEPLGELRVDACPSQAEQLLAWAAGWPERAWAVEGADGLGRLLAQQLVTAGEQVLDVPPKLAARVRLLQAGATNKNDPNDAFSVAVAALRSPARRPVLAEDHAAVLKVWAKRHPVHGMNTCHRPREPTAGPRPLKLSSHCRLAPAKGHQLTNIRFCRARCVSRTSRGIEVGAVSGHDELHRTAARPVRSSGAGY
jgi:hypothetical protein